MDIDQERDMSMRSAFVGEAARLLVDSRLSGKLAMGESRGECAGRDLSNTDVYVYADGELAATPLEDPRGDPSDLAFTWGRSQWKSTAVWSSFYK